MFTVYKHTILAGCVAESIIIKAIVVIIKIPIDNELLIYLILAQLVQEYLKFWCKQKSMNRTTLPLN